MLPVKSKTKKVAKVKKAVKEEPAGLESDQKEKIPPTLPFSKGGAGLELAVFNQEGKEVEKIKLPQEIFGLKVNQDLVKQAYEAQMSQSRIPYAHAKDRSEVRGGGKKPWRQKGTGRARHGSIRSPIWRGGGATFGPRKERIFAKNINKKMKRKALLMVLSGKARDNEVVVLNDLKLEQSKTKEMAKILKNIFGIPSLLGKKPQQAEESNRSFVAERLSSGLIVLPQKDENVIRATRNIPKFSTIGANSLNVVDLLNYKYLIMPKEAIEVIEKTFLNRE